MNHAYPPTTATTAVTAKNLASGGSVPPRPSFQNQDFDVTGSVTVVPIVVCVVFVVKVRRQR